MVKVTLYSSQQHYPGRKYYAGETVSGTVYVECDSLLLTRSIYVGIWFVEKFVHKKDEYSASLHNGSITPHVKTKVKRGTQTLYARYIVGYHLVYLSIYLSIYLSSHADHMYSSFFLFLIDLLGISLEQS